MPLLLRRLTKYPNASHKEHAFHAFCCHESKFEGNYSRLFYQDAKSPRIGAFSSLFGIFRHFCFGFFGLFNLYQRNPISSKVLSAIRFKLS